MEKDYTLGELKELAQEFADQIKTEKKPRVLALTGDLGSGKTTFVQFLAEALGIKKRILSPTFVIAREYPFRAGDKEMFLHHIDLYRLDENGLKYLDFKDLFDQDDVVVAIEWAEKAHALPPHTTYLKFTNKDSNTRHIESS